MVNCHQLENKIFNIFILKIKTFQRKLFTNPLSVILSWGDLGEIRITLGIDSRGHCEYICLYKHVFDHWRI